MKTVLLFDTDDFEDGDRLRDAQAGREMRFAIRAIDQELRTKTKHAPDDQASEATAAYEAAREILRNELVVRSLDWILGE